MKTKELFSIEVIEDCWFDANAVGDMDFGITVNMDDFIKQHGYEKACHLIRETVETVLERSKPKASDEVKGG